MNRLSFACLFLLGCGSSGSTKPVVGPNANLTSVGSTDALIGGTGLLIVRFDNPLPNDLDVTLTSSQTATATVPSTATIKRGTLSGELSYQGVALGTSVLTVTAGGSSATTTVSVVDAFRVQSVNFGNSTIEKNATTPLYVYLNAAPPSPIPVTIALSDPSLASGPATVSVGGYPGNTVQSLTAMAAGTETVTATLGDSMVSGQLKIVDHARLNGDGDGDSLVAEVGYQLQADLALDAVVAAATTINVASSDPTVLAGGSFVVPAGSSDVALTGTILKAGSTDLTATLADSTETRHITGVTAPSLTRLDLSSGTVGTTRGGTVELDALAAQPHVVTLTSSDPTLVAVPATVTLLPNNRQVGFEVQLLKIGVATITASFGGKTLSQNVVSQPAQTAATLTPTTAMAMVGDVVGFTLNWPSGVATVTSSDPTVVQAPGQVIAGSDFDVQCAKAGQSTITVSIAGQMLTTDVTVVDHAELQLTDAVRIPDGSQPGSMNISFNVDIPGGSAITFASSNTAVLPTPPTFLTPYQGSFFQVHFPAMSDGISILTVSAVGGTKTIPVYVGQAAQLPNQLNYFAPTLTCLEVGGVVTVQAQTTEAVTSDLPIAVSLPPSPSPFLATTDSSPFIPLGDNDVFFAIAGTGVGDALVSFSLLGTTETFDFQVVNQSTFSYSGGNLLNLGVVAQKTLSSDCALAAPRQAMLISDDTSIFTVSPAMITLPVNNNASRAFFQLTPVAVGTTNLTIQPLGSPSPAPVIVPITVNP